MKDQTASRPRSAAHRLHCHIAHRLRRNIISQRIARYGRHARLIHLEDVETAQHPLPVHHLPIHHLAASNIDLDDLTSTLNLFDTGHVNG